MDNNVQIKASVINNIMKEMVSKGYSKMDLAKNLGWSPSKITKIFSLEQNLTMEDFLAIALELKQNPALLLSAEDILTTVEMQSLRTIMLKANMMGIKEAIDTLTHALPQIMTYYLNLSSETTSVYSRIRKRGAENSAAFGIIPGSAPRVVIIDESEGSLYGKDVSVGYWFKEDLSGAYLCLNYNPDDSKKKSAYDEDAKTIEKTAHAFKQLLAEGNFGTDKIKLSDKHTPTVSRCEKGMIVYRFYDFSDLPSEDELKADLLHYYDLYKQLLTASVERIRKLIVTENILEETSDGAIISHKRSVLKNTKIAKVAKEKANYCCEVDETHKTFLTKDDGKQYMQVHHLVPLEQQHNFDVALDVVGNVVCICPVCHLKLSYGTDKDKEEVLMTLYMKHRYDLEDAGIKVTLMQLFKFYGMN